jgi:hypothetical protein
MQTDRLNAWEKAALFTVGSASAFNVLLWALGSGLADAAPGLTPLGVLRVAFAVASFVGLDLTIVVTVMAQRDGRRSMWAWLTATAAMLAAGGMGLEVAGVVAWPWLHAAPVVVLFAFMHHLAAPRVAHRAEVLAQEVAQTGADLAHLGAELAQRVEDVAQRDAEAARMRGELAQTGAEVARLRRELAHEREAMAQRQLTDGAEAITVGARSFSLRQLARVTGVPESTLRNRMAQTTEGV